MLLSAPNLLGLGDVPASARVLRLAGGGAALYSMLSDCDLGAVKLVPMPVHLARPPRLRAGPARDGGDGGIAADYSPTFYASFVAAFLDTLGIERAAIVGSACLGRTISPALSLLTLPG
jgi:hypothetical protein